jgi:hypothetical protein
MANRIETGAMAIAALALGGATGFAAFVLLGPVGTFGLRALAAAAVAASACLAGWWLLNRVGAQAPAYPVATFEPGSLEQAPLELTEVHQPPLDLDDVLHAVGPDARVVRLFDVRATASPAELKARVDRYLGQGASWARSPDASQALVDALTELRRSLR